ncbi:PH domain-containing protein [Paenibacillus albidus]|uniref:PH domain-containing protein n=1 Tax=Paenibacillus albidus TaxID=2041023 RepID=UPI001BEAA907|nr:PH domain-containing protein [Paenibacillus albidus]MBT2293440.1 PH domain-containing protein [Paenibacillus albidus]
MNEISKQEIVLWEGKPAGLSDRFKGIFRLNTTTYTLTTQRIIIKTGLFGKNVEEIELLRVRDLSVVQSIPDRMLGIGSLIVFSDDASAPQLLIRKIRDAQTIKDVLRKAVRDEKAAHNISYRDHI